MFQPRPWVFPDTEKVAAAYLRSRHPGVFVSRTHPASLPLTVVGTTYTSAIVVRTDGGPNRPPLASRRPGVTVRGADLSATKDLAESVGASLQVWPLAEASTVADVSVRDSVVTSDEGDPPELYLSADLSLFGTIQPETP